MPMDVTNLHSNIPQQDSITTVCRTCEEFHQKAPPVPTRLSREMLSLILQENSFQFNKIILKPIGQPWHENGVSLADIFMAKIEKEILTTDKALQSPSFQEKIY